MSTAADFAHGTEVWVYGYPESYPAVTLGPVDNRIEQIFGGPHAGPVPKMLRIRRTDTGQVKDTGPANVVTRAAADLAWHVLDGDGCCVSDPGTSREDATRIAAEGGPGWTIRQGVPATGSDWAPADAIGFADPDVQSRHTAALAALRKNRAAPTTPENPTMPRKNATARPRPATPRSATAALDAVAAAANDRLQKAPDAVAGAESLAPLTPRELHRVADLNHIEVPRGAFREQIVALLMDDRFGGRDELFGEDEAADYLIRQMNVPAERARQYARIGTMYPGSRDMSPGGLRDAARQMPTTVPDTTGRHYQAPAGAQPITREAFLASATAEGYDPDGAEWAYDWAASFWGPDVFDATMAAAAGRTLHHFRPRAAPPAAGGQAASTGHDEVTRTDLTAPVAEQRLTEVADTIGTAAEAWGAASDTARDLLDRVTDAPWATTAITDAFRGLLDRIGARPAVAAEVDTMRTALIDAGRALADAITGVGAPAAAHGATGDVEAYQR